MAQHYIDSLLGTREKILHSARQHWFILIRNILAEVSVIFIIFIATIVASFYLQLHIPLPVIVLVGFALLLLPIATMTRDVLMWSNRQYIVTNRRVIQISGVINKSVIDSSLEKVNDVKMVQSVLGRAFNYGDIEIMTASELGANLFTHIDKPVHFKTAMLNAKEALGRGEYGEHRKEESIPTLIEQLDALRQKGTLTEEEFLEKKAQLLAKL
jgi:uncharacterized membrane protein YdbT with pleckstrin-like domain